MRLVATIVGLFLAAVIFTAVNPQVKAQAQPTQEQPTEARTERYVKVKPGDSLSKIAGKNKTTYKRLFYANKQIKDPDLIYPNDKLRVPHKDEKLKERPLTKAQEVTAKVSEKTYSATPQTSSVPQAPAVASGSVWDRLAACESGGNWSINTGNGYYGGLQFSLGTWRSVGGSGYPHQHSRAEQIMRGKILQARSGWGQWPACTAKLGLR